MSAGVPEARRGPGRLALSTWLVAMGVALVARGRVHPDEIFQALEPAHRLVFGSGDLAWEWSAGLRNWALPGLLAGPLWLLCRLGVRDPRPMALLVFALCSGWQALGTIYLYRLVEERDGAGPARLAGILQASWGGLAIYAARPIGDALAIPPLLAALCFTARAARRGDGRAGILAGLSLGLAVVLRYPSLVFALPVGGTLLRSRRPRAILGGAAGLGLALAGLGLLDRATWGQAFFSLRHYLAFNGPAGAAAATFGARPWWWYGPIFAGMAPLPLFWPFAKSLRRPGLAHAAFAAYLAALELHPHKEPRFLLPLLPLLAVAAAPEAFRELERLRARIPAAGRWLAGGYLAYSLGAASLLLPFALNRDVVDGEVAAGRDPSLGGLLVDDGPWATGGRFYLQRDVPVRYLDGSEVAAGLHDARYSHLLLLDGLPVPRELLEQAGFEPWWRRGATSVWRRPPADRPSSSR